MRPSHLLLLASLTLSPLAASAQSGASFRFHHADGPVRAEAIHAFARNPSGWERTKLATDAFLGAPYVVSPLGEGAGLDADPRVRWDGVDCLTFVETALAVGNAEGEEAAQIALDDIRYAAGTRPSYESRLHLMIAQWIPDQIRKGYLEDVTTQFGPAVPASIGYDEKRWSTRRGPLRAVPWSDKLAGTFSIPMIPIADAQQIAGTLPEGLVINVVREARADRLNRVTHTGFVVVRDGKRYVRHARLGRAVVDEPIERFLGRHAQMRKWVVSGIQLLAVRDNGARVRALVERERGTVTADAAQ